jgi:hypothetical protein
MSRRDKLMLGACALCLGAAAFSFIWQGTASSGETKAFFYDLSKKKLFAAPASLVPPIKGVDNAEEDAVKAVVISTNGNPRDKKAWKIAYLEKYSPEMKREFERAQKEGSSPSVSRAMAQTQKFVKRPEDSQWYPMNTAEASRILNEWLTAGPGGTPAVVCAP